MARKGAIDADASGGSTQEVAKRDRLVSPVQLNVPLGGAAGQRRVPGTGAIATLARERALRLGSKHRSRGRKRQRRAP